ncbi:flavin reductase family protein [Cognatishimia sp. WU-CL00825]|uniref:flavin reductase family protein n=1 Tax=Cognatishimia sp. WU-CL00825 TaxID=3127658 RepID=UPI00310A402A
MPMSATTSFVPGPETAREFRDALGCFATGVTVVTAQTASGPIGMTANSFSSLSLTPPLVLWSPAKSSKRYPFFAAATHFAIHVMRQDQAHMAQTFAKSGDCFGQFDWVPNDNGVPVLDACLGVFECTQVASHDAGDHQILIGQVDRAAFRSGSPLVFSRGKYGNFSPLG